MAHSMTIEGLLALEKPSFEQFPDYVALRVEDGIFHALAEYLKRHVTKDGKASLTLPWGTYAAEVKTVGEGTNITPTYTPSKAFIKALNDDDSRDLRQETFDEEYAKLLRDWVADGRFDGSDVKNLPAKDKGFRMKDEEVEFFLNDYMQVLVNIARDKQREGKVFRLEIKEAFPHGAFDFIYDDDKIDVKFIPDKNFKQYLKDDDISNADFSGQAANRFSHVFGGSNGRRIRKVEANDPQPLLWEPKWKKGMKPSWMKS